MEIAGLAIGGAGLVGAFKTTLEIVDRVSTAKAYGREYELFISLLGQERDRL
jgi:hypothetical protein